MFLLVSSEDWQTSVTDVTDLFLVLHELNVVETVHKYEGLMSILLLYFNVCLTGCLIF